MQQTMSKYHLLFVSVCLWNVGTALEPLDILDPLGVFDTPLFNALDPLGICGHDEEPDPAPTCFECAPGDSSCSRQGECFTITGNYIGESDNIYCDIDMTFETSFLLEYDVLFPTLDADQAVTLVLGNPNPFLFPEFADTSEYAHLVGVQEKFSVEWNTETDRFIAFVGDDLLLNTSIPACAIKLAFAGFGFNYGIGFDMGNATSQSICISNVNYTVTNPTKVDCSDSQ